VVKVISYVLVVLVLSNFTLIWYVTDYSIKDHPKQMDSLNNRVIKFQTDDNGIVYLTAEEFKKVNLIKTLFNPINVILATLMLIIKNKYKLTKNTIYGHNRYHLKKNNGWFRRDL
jgi:uncharacterized membrane protein